MNNRWQIYIRGIRATIAGLALVAFWACTPTVPSRYIQPDEMEDILYDYHLAQAMAQRETNYQEGQKNRTLYFYAVLAKHNVSEADFDSSMVYYYSNIPQLQKVYEAVEERMDNEANHLGATIMERQTTTLSANGDTANIWKGSSSAMLMPVIPYNRMDFEMKIDTSFHKGDEFLWTFDTDFLYQSGTKDAVIYTAVTFDNDSTAQYYTHVSSTGKSQLRIPSNFKNSIKKMRGFIYLTRGNDNSNTLKLMFIDRIFFLRYHKKEQPKTKPTTPAPTKSKPDSIKVVASPQKEDIQPAKNGSIQSPPKEGARPMPNAKQPLKPIQR